MIPHPHLISRPSECRRRNHLLLPRRLRPHTHGPKQLSLTRSALRAVSLSVSPSSSSHPLPKEFPSQLQPLLLSLPLPRPPLHPPTSLPIQECPSSVCTGKSPVSQLQLQPLSPIHPKTPPGATVPRPPRPPTPLRVCNVSSSARDGLRCTLLPTSPFCPSIHAVVVG